MKIHNSLRGLVLGAVLLLTGATARAQYTNPYTGTTWNNPMSSYLDTVILNNQRMSNLMNTQMMQRSMMQMTFDSLNKGRKKTPQQQKQAVEAQKFLKYKGTMFKPATPVMPARLAALFEPKDAKARADIQKIFGALLEVYKQRAKEQNAPPNDVARTLAYATAANYIYFNGGNKNVPESQISALRGRLRVALAGDAKFRAMSDKDKQQASETLIILTHLIAYSMDEVAPQLPAAQQAQVKAGYRKMAGTLLQSLTGVAPQRVSFDKDGLVVKPA